jgi:hypothetical protein
MSACRLERRSGFRLAPEYHIQDVLKVWQPGKWPQPWIAAQGSRTEEAFRHQMVYGLQSVRFRSVACQLPCQVESAFRSRCRLQFECTLHDLDALDMIALEGETQGIDHRCAEAALAQQLGSLGLPPRCGQGCHVQIKAIAPEVPLEGPLVVAQ